MKLVMILLLTGVLSAQTVYRVTPGTSDNKIVLTIENDQTNPAMANVKAIVTEQPSTITFNQKELTIPALKQSSSGEIEFSFDVNRIVKADKVDTLAFDIKTPTGNWKKEILIGYELPIDFRLDQNYPNPFNPETKISYQLPSACKVCLKVYDVLGSEVATLVNDEQEAGYYEKSFSGKNLASGMYIYRLESENVNLVKKMVLLK